MAAKGDSGGNVVKKLCMQRIFLLENSNPIDQFLPKAITYRVEIRGLSDIKIPDISQFFTIEI